MTKIQYDNPFTCNKCGGDNNTTIQDSIENIVTEYITICTVCGFEDYWCTGFFESHLDGFNSSEKYFF